MAAQTSLATMHQMRQSGATLDQVGSRFGITKEGVRQLLTRYYGSTRVSNLLTAIELARLAGCGYRYIVKLRRRGVIQPEMVVGQGRTLWNPETIATVIIYIDRHSCPVCHGPVPSNKVVYCSRQCYLKANRYKNQPKEVKRRHDETVKRWLRKHPEAAKQIRRRARKRREDKKARERYQTTNYVI